MISDIPVLDDSGNVLHIQELAGPSSGKMPTDGMANGSLFLETDTGYIYLFDEDNGWWSPDDNEGGAAYPGSPDDDEGGAA